MRNKKLIVIICVLAFVTLIVFLGSVVFSVQSVYASCYNDNDEELDAAVAALDNNGISRGRSIFMLNESRVIEAVERACDNVKVVNVERKFPNQVYINYVKIFPYLVYETGESALLVSNRCKILFAADKQESYPDYIRLISAEGPSSVNEGELIFAEGTDTYPVVSELLEAMERMDLRSVVVDMLEFIDVTYTHSAGMTYVKTRLGTYFELQGGASALTEKIRLAVSVYLSDVKYMHGGTIIVNSSGTGAAYSDENRYENRVGGA